MSSRLIVCARCEWISRPSGRGLGVCCYASVKKAGRLHEYPRTYRSMDETLADYTMLRGQGLRLPDIAARMGMTFAALERQVCRAKKRGLIA